MSSQVRTRPIWRGTQNLQWDLFCHIGNTYTPVENTALGGITFDGETFPPENTIQIMHVEFFPFFSKKLPGFGLVAINKYETWN